MLNIYSERIDAFLDIDLSLRRCCRFSEKPESFRTSIIVARKDNQIGGWMDGNKRKYKPIKTIYKTREMCE